MNSIHPSHWILPGITVIQLDFFPLNMRVACENKPPIFDHQSIRLNYPSLSLSPRALGTGDNAAKEGETNPLSLQILWTWKTSTELEWGSNGDPKFLAKSSFHKKTLKSWWSKEKSLGTTVSKLDYNIWVFPKIGVPQNGRCIREKPIRIDDLGGPPLFSETSICISIMIGYNL